MSFPIARHRAVRTLTRGGIAAAMFAVAAPATALTIVPVFDASLTGQAAAGAIEAAFNTVADDYNRSFSTAATVYIGVSWGKVGAQALPSNAVGASSTNLYGYYTYAQIKALLTTVAAANPADKTLVAALRYLPASAPAGPTNYVVTAAQAKALGLIAPTLAAYDGYIGFAGATSGFGFTPASVTSSQYDFQSVAAHEIAEVLGRISGVGTGQWRTALDLFRYSAPGALSYAYSAKTYFSVDGGTTRLINFNAAATGDRGDWATSGTTRDAYDAFIGHGQRKNLSAIDLAALDVLGWSGANAGNTGVTPVGTVFNLTAVPEPASWALMVAGFGLVGAAVRRRGAATA